MRGSELTTGTGLRSLGARTPGGASGPLPGVPDEQSGGPGEQGLSSPHPPAVPAPQPSGRPPATAPTSGSLALPQAQLHSTPASRCRSTHISASPPPQTQLSQPPLASPGPIRSPPRPLLPTHPPLPCYRLRLGPHPRAEGAFQSDTSDRERKGIATGMASGAPAGGTGTQNPLNQHTTRA